jgi:hypothetical protein
LTETLRNTIWRVLQKLTLQLPYDPGIPLLGTYPKEMKLVLQKDVCTPMFTTVLITTAKIWIKLVSLTDK